MPEDIAVIEALRDPFLAPDHNSLLKRTSPPSARMAGSKDKRIRRELHPT